MNVVRDTTIVGQIREAIMSFSANNQAIERIELTTLEMEELVKAPIPKTYVGKYYASEENPVLLNIKGVRKEGDVPSSLWYMGVYIVRKD